MKSSVYTHRGNIQDTILDTRYPSPGSGSQGKQDNNLEN